MNSIKVQFGDVRKKSIITQNQFVSHMIEHIAWRLGISIEVLWQDQNWQGLGIEFGKQIKKFTSRQNRGVALGMIDDGSAEVTINISEKGLKFDSIKQIDLKWFLSMRCEQLVSGEPLVDLLRGLSDGLGARIEIIICSFEDPHHTWEGVFRGVGMALNKIFTPETHREINDFKKNKISKRKNSVTGNLVVSEASVNKAVVYRKTAETLITLEVHFGDKRKNKILIDVDKSIDVQGLDRLLCLITKEAGFRLSVDFKAQVLSSSHVVWEDIGMVFGRALLEVLKIRMEQIGVNGAGSNLSSVTALGDKSVSLGLSVEGRKFWKIFPTNADYQTIRKNFLLGQNILGNLRSEDLDDFIDGFCGGMGCSLIIVVKKLLKPEAFWVMVFTGIGEAIEEVFISNSYRKGVPPGVKANLS